MNNKFLKKIAKVCIILLIITIVAILAIINYIKKYNEISTKGQEGYDYIDEYGKKTNEGIDYEAYFDVKSCMQKYLNSITEGSPLNTFNLLSTKYINENNITNENVNKHFQKFQEPTIYIPVETKMIQDEDKIKSFLTYGFVDKLSDYSLIDKRFTIVNIDLNNWTFSIEPIKGEFNSIDEVTIQNSKEMIEANEDNEFASTYLENGAIPQEYINIIKGLAFGATERLYELLDEEYKNVKFGNLDKFKDYIQNKKAEITYSSIKEYQTSTGENNFRYVCIDNFGNYYVINEKATFEDYSIMLDTYTVDLPEFIEKYDNAEEHKKVALNIQKLITATENKDYEYVYNKLDDTFKASKFPTLEEFKNYIKEKYNSDDRITYDLYKKAANVHLYDIKVTNTSTAKDMSARIVMDLEDNRDFKFSFSANN